jgi:hypothetical protein
LEVTTRARLALNDHDIAEAFDDLCERGIIDDDTAQMVAELAEELAAKRLQKEDEVWKN